jgi:hypothetical protein
MRKYKRFQWKGFMIHDVEMRKRDKNENILWFIS